MDCCFLQLNNLGKRLQWDLTELCNLNCLHCCAGKRINIDHYDDEIIVATVERIKQCGFEKVSLSGGEPTLNKSFSVIVKTLYEKNINVGIISNLCYDFSKIANSIDYIDSITTSIDGEESIHNMIRGATCYQTTIMNIEKLIRVGKKVKVIYTLQNNNFDCLENSISILRSIGVKNMMLAHISPQGRGITNSEKLKFSLSDRELKQLVKDLSHGYDMNITTSKCSYLSSAKSDMCLAGKHVFYLSPDLLLYPCHLRISYGVSLFSENPVEQITNYIKSEETL